MKVFIGILLLAASALAADGPQPDRWHGLILDVSTAADASAIGAASTPRPDKLPTLPDIGKRFEQDLMKKPLLQRVDVKGVEGFRSVALYFRDGKLVAMLLSFKQQINTEALKNIYGVDFQPYIGGAEASSNGDVNRVFGPGPRRGGFPVSYSLVAITEKSTVCALVNNGISGIGDIIKGSPAGGFPGKVGAVMLTSRTLDDRQGSDLLK